MKAFQSQFFPGTKIPLFAFYAQLSAPLRQALLDAPMQPVPQHP